MSIIPLYGHEELTSRLLDAAARNALPASLLLQGPRGVGKQRVALWLAELLLCESIATRPCGVCRGCRFVLELTHPDLHWYFPRPRLRGGDADDLDEVKSDYAEAVAERAGNDGMYEPSSGMEGLFVGTVRLIVQQAALTPAIGKRKVFIVGDAERMTPQEGSDQAANAFLKLLEEPPSDTTIVLTSSESGALLPTVRSRVVAMRVAPLSAQAMGGFLADERVSERLKGDERIPPDRAARILLSGGVPGRLLGGASWVQALQNAQRLLEVVPNRGEHYEAGWAQGASRARGSFADTLDALTVLLHQRTAASVRDGAERAALGASLAIEVVEAAKEQVASNVSPQLITVGLLGELQELLI